MALPKTSAATRGLVLVLLAGASLAACATPQPKYPGRLPQAGPSGMPSGAGGGYKVGKPYQVGGIWYVPREDPHYDVRGVASWYGDAFHNKKTANGELFNKNALSAAHTTLPLPSIVEVTNLENGRSLRVRVNDRGPFVGGRVIDLSHAAARELGFDRQGLAKVRVRYVGPAPVGGSAPPPRRTSISEAPAPPPVAPPAVPEPVVEAAEAPSGAIVQTALAPLPSAPRDAAVTAAPSAPEFRFRIQAGAFGDVMNAQRAADSLSGIGARAVIEPVERGGGTLYRVMVAATADEGEAWALRDLVAGYGFADARVIRPF